MLRHILESVHKNHIIYPFILPFRIVFPFHSTLYNIYSLDIVIKYLAYEWILKYHMYPVIILSSFIYHLSYHDFFVWIDYIEER